MLIEKIYVFKNKKMKYLFIFVDNKTNKKKPHKYNELCFAKKKKIKKNQKKSYFFYSSSLTAVKAPVQTAQNR